jgi:hypothetical protein
MPGAALGFLYAGYSLAALTLGGVLTGLAVAGLAALAVLAPLAWTWQGSLLPATYSLMGMGYPDTAAAGRPPGGTTVTAGSTSAR